MSINSTISEDIYFDADRLRIEELFTNIFDNAVKYSNINGSITIHADENNKEVSLSIQDDGIGITNEQLEKIFDEFYKADQSRHDFESSGFGMPIAKRIVEKHGGKIWAESKGIGKGTTFYFKLPKEQFERNPF